MEPASFLSVHPSPYDPGKMVLSPSTGWYYHLVSVWFKGGHLSLSQSIMGDLLGGNSEEVFLEVTVYVCDHCLLQTSWDSGEQQALV